MRLHCISLKTPIAFQSALNHRRPGYLALAIHSLLPTTYLNSTPWMHFGCKVLTRNLHTTTRTQQKTYTGSFSGTKNEQCETQNQRHITKNKQTETRHEQLGCIYTKRLALRSPSRRIVSRIRLLPLRRGGAGTDKPASRYAACVSSHLADSAFSASS